MENSPELLLKEVAFIFQRNELNRSSAIVYAEVAKGLQKDPGVWTGLGSALAKSADEGPKKDFQVWSAKALKRGLLIGQGGPFESPCCNWLDLLMKDIDVVEPDPFEVEELDDLLTFLDEGHEHIVKDLSKLPADDIGKVLFGIGKHGAGQFVNVVMAYLNGDLGEEYISKSLKYLPKFGDYPAVREKLAELAVEVDSGLQPELGEVMTAISPEWAAKFNTK